MFGGLEVKADDEKKEGNGAASASAFGFLNASPTGAPAPSADPVAGSGFSFLNPSTPQPEVSEPAPAEVTSSGFSFLQETPPTTTEPATTVDTENTAAAASGFSFLIPSPDKAPTPEDAEVKPPSPALPPATANSAFNFLSGASQDEEDAEPAPMPSVSITSAASVASSVVSGPSPLSTAPPNVLDIPTGLSMPTVNATTTSTGPPGLPTGAGVTFGTANKPVVRKKKSRAQKVGMGLSAVTNSSPPKAPAPTPAPKKVESPQSSSETRDAAVEAQRRAEEFMNKKSLAETMQPTTTKPPTPSLSIPTYDEEPPEVPPSTSTDEEVARAQRAAEEAQKISVAGKEPSRGGFMGTFFKGFGGSSSSINKGSGHSAPNKAPPSPTLGVDNVTKKQQEMKRAAAERQMEMQRQSTTDEGDVAAPTVETSHVGSYQPEPIVEPKPSPPSMSITSAFKPAEIPTKPAPIVVRELAPTPRKKKTAKQAFEEYQALFAQSAHRAMQQVEAVRSQQKMLTEERFVAIAKQRLSTQQIEQTEVQLQLAVDNEDYELADQLGQVIESHNRERAEVASVLDNIAKALEQLESQKALVVNGVATCFDNLAVHIKDLQENQNSRDRDSDAETLNQFGLISKQLSAEQERLNQDLKLLERDAQQIAEERKEVESAISEQSGAYEKQKDDAKEKLGTVEEEIAELRRQLEAKSKIAAGLRTEVHGLEDSISRVRVKFSRQLSRVDKKEKDAKDSRVDWESEMVAHKRQKEAHDLQVQSHSEALLEHDSLMKIMETELTLCKELAGMVSTKLGFMLSDSKSKEAEDAENEGNLAQLQANVVKCEAACSEAKILFKASKAAVAKLETEHSILTARIPQLEEEKKSAAAKRDFKAASKASKEIKDSTTRLRECEEELAGESAEKLAATEQELARLLTELERTRKIAEKEEKVSGLARMQELAGQIKSLVATQKELCGEASSGDNTVKGVGSFVLESQIKALKDEGEELGSKFGGWSELVKDILFTDGGSTIDESPAVEVEASPPPPQFIDDGLTSEERIAKVRALMKRIEEAEPLLEAAVEREDYDEAARLQEIFENAQSELENMNLTEEESMVAFNEEEAAPTEAEDELIAESVQEAEAPKDEEHAESEQDNNATKQGDEVETKELEEDSVAEAKMDHDDPGDEEENTTSNVEESEQCVEENNDSLDDTQEDKNSDGNLEPPPFDATTQDEVQDGNKSQDSIEGSDGEADPQLAKLSD